MGAMSGMRGMGMGMGAGTTPDRKGTDVRNSDRAKERKEKAKSIEQVKGPSLFDPHFDIVAGHGLRPGTVLQSAPSGRTGPDQPRRHDCGRWKHHPDASAHGGGPGGASAAAPQTGSAEAKPQTPASVAPRADAKTATTAPAKARRPSPTRRRPDSKNGDAKTAAPKADAPKPDSTKGDAKAAAPKS